MVMPSSAIDRQRQVRRRDLAAAQLAPDDQRQPGEAEHEAEPLARRHRARAAATAHAPVSQSAVSTGCRPTSSAAGAGADARLHRRPDAAEVAACISMPMTARCSHCARPRGQAARASAIQTPKQTTESAIAHGQELIGGACGIARRATTKPVLQISTKTHGIAADHARAAWRQRHFARARISGSAFCR